MAAVGALALAALSGCYVTATDNPLPDSSRIEMPDVRGIWLFEVPPDAEGGPYQSIIIVSARPRDERGCMHVRLALFGADGEAGYDWDSREVYEPDVTWCAYRIAGLTVIEEQRLDPDQPWYQHALFSQDGDIVRFRYFDHEIVSYVLDSALRKHAEDTFVTLSSTELQQALEAHAKDLETYLQQADLPEFRRLVPLPSD